MGLVRNIKNQILELKKQGFNYREISEKLNCSIGTIAYHFSSKERKKKKNSQRQIRRKINKRILIDIKGGKCCVCGYNKCIEALQFHHVNPEEKDFEISSNHTENIEEMKEEIKKCVLVCGNCHAEIEAGIISLDFSCVSDII